MGEAQTALSLLNLAGHAMSATNSANTARPASPANGNAFAESLDRAQRRMAPQPPEPANPERPSPPSSAPQPPEKAPPAATPSPSSADSPAKAPSGDQTDGRSTPPDKRGEVDGDARADHARDAGKAARGATDAASARRTASGGKMSGAPDAAPDIDQAGVNAKADPADETDGATSVTLDPAVMRGADAAAPAIDAGAANTATPANGMPSHGADVLAANAASADAASRLIGRDTAESIGEDGDRAADEGRSTVNGRSSRPASADHAGHGRLAHETTNFARETTDFARETADATGAGSAPGGAAGRGGLDGRDARQGGGTADTTAAGSARGTGLPGGLAGLAHASGTAAPGSSAPAAQTTLGTPVPDPRFPRALAEQVSLFVASDVKSANILVSPPEMGPIRIELTVSGDDARIVFTAAHPDTRQAIEQSSAVLRSLLAERGVGLGQMDVGHGDPQQAFAQAGGQGNGAAGDGGQNGRWGGSPVDRDALTAATNAAIEQAAVRRNAGLLDLFA